jgi:phage shock protein C
MADTAPSPPQARVLRRSSEDRVIAGVCGGLGRYLGVDAVLLRIVFVVLAVAGGSGVLLYVLCWIFIPSERPGEIFGPTRSLPGATGRILAGTGLIALGTILLLDRVWPWFGRVIGPITLIAIGIAVLVWGTRR